MTVQTLYYLTKGSLLNLRNRIGFLRPGYIKTLRPHPTSFVITSYNSLIIFRSFDKICRNWYSVCGRRKSSTNYQLVHLPLVEI